MTNTDVIIGLPIQTDPYYFNNESSGIVGTSGIVNTSGDLSGPWKIEEQWLDITYTRVPNYVVSSVKYGLSSVSRGVGITGTFLLVRASAQYVRYKSYDNFSTSSWTQPQTFKYHTFQGDDYGNNYGLSSDYGVSALGPNGIIQTMNSWYDRRRWNEKIDTSAQEFCVGTRHYYALIGSATSWDGRITGKPGEYKWGEFERQGPLPYEAHTFMESDSCDSGDWIFRGSPEYYLAGTYDPKKESSFQIQNFINLMGTKVTDSKFYSIGSDWIDTDAGGFVPPENNRIQGCPSYSTTRHNWS